MAILFFLAASGVAPQGGRAQEPPLPDADSLAGPGISLALARHRAATLSDLQYHLAFTVPGDTGSIRGSLTLGLTRAADGPLILDFAEAGTVHGVEADGVPVDFEHQDGHVVLPAGAVPPGRREIRITFTAGDAPLNRREEFLYTLFVPDRAHEAFPAFDQPDLKARFTLELDLPAEWTAVANGGEASRVRRDGRAVWRFAPTEPIPTYLFAFAAGVFEVVEAERDGRVMRMLHRETDDEKVDRNTAAIFDLHGTALRWLEDYTGIEYPFGKFDFVAIPSFQYGGMEHPGAILYRADALFLDESATRNQELGRASLIAHETAHMWFGDLVTMTWFDDVWMKEVFANFMAAKIVNPSFPDIDHDLRFLLAHYPAAYGVDRTAGANPIRQPLLNLDDAGSLYGAIIYQKAPIVMRQLERLTGQEAFRTALRRYLAGHAFGNAGWPALVEALDAVSPMDVRAWSRVWIEEPGRPTITVSPSGTLTQTDPRGRGLEWEQALAPLPLEGERHVLPNADGLGYGLFILDGATRDFLLDSLPALEEPLTRAVAWLDLMEMMREGLVAPEAMLDLGRRALAVEENELLTQEILGDLSAIFWRHLSAGGQGAHAADLEAELWEGIQEAGTTSLKSAYFNAWRSMATTYAATHRMRRVWSGELEIDGLPLSEQDRTTLAFRLAILDPGRADTILDVQRERIENADRRARFDFIRPAVSPDPAVRDSFFASLEEPGSRSREAWVVTALAYLNHPLRADASLRYVRPALDLLEEVKATGDIFFPTRWLAATLGGHGSPAAAEIVRTFLAEHPDYPLQLEGKLLQEADHLLRLVEPRER